MVLLLWFFMASLIFSSLVILLLMPSRYKPLSNFPAHKGMLKKKTTHELNVKHKALNECRKKKNENKPWDSLISARLDFDLKNSNDGPMVRCFNVGAASVFDHFYVLSISALEQYSVL